jgi:hypothetical protein
VEDLQRRLLALMLTGVQSTEQGGRKMGYRTKKPLPHFSVILRPKAHYCLLHHHSNRSFSLLLPALMLSRLFSGRCFRAQSDQCIYSTGSEHSSRCSEAHLFGAEFSDFHVPKEDPIEPRCDQLDTQLFEAEYLGYGNDSVQTGHLVHAGCQ